MIAQTTTTVGNSVFTSTCLSPSQQRLADAVLCCSPSRLTIHLCSWTPTGIGKGALASLPGKCQGQICFNCNVLVYTKTTKIFATVHVSPAQNTPKFICAPPLTWYKGHSLQCRGKGKVHGKGRRK